MSFASLRRSFAFAAAVGLSSVLTGCPGDKPETKLPEAEQSLDDAYALLPGSAIAVGTVDARAFFGNPHAGADIVKLVERFMPIGQEAGFAAGRDVDRIVFGSYSYQGIDVSAVVVGRFDSAKIKQVATSQSPTKAGVPLVMSSYANRDVYTVNNVGFTLLSDTKAIVGTENGIRRVLDRIKDHRVKRDLPAWMIGTLDTSGAAFAVAADFASQPIPPEAVQQVPRELTTGLKAVRAVGQFKDGGVQVAGSMTYAEPSNAEQAAEIVKKTAGYSRLLAFIGIQIKNFETKVEKSDVQVTVGIDDQSLRVLLTNVPAMLGK